MFTDTEFKDFIIKHRAEILKNDWTAIYDDLLSYLDVSNLTDFLLNKAHINPLYYMTSVPIYFAYKLDIPSINIPNNVTIIGRYAFYNCSSLTSITIPNSVTSIGDSAFNNCINLTSITIPNSVTKIGEWAFQNCRSLTTINIPNSVTEIGESAFSGCSSLTSIKIPDGVTRISYRAFQNCTSLTSITIPNSITEIIYHAFAGCRNLKEIKYTGTESEGNALLSNVNYLLKFIQQRNIKVIFI